MTSLFLTSKNSTKKEIEINFNILKYIKYIGGEDCVDYTIDDYKKEVGNVKNIYLEVPDLTDEQIDKINDFVQKIRKINGQQNYLTKICPNE